LNLRDSKDIKQRPKRKGATMTLEYPPPQADKNVMPSPGMPTPELQPQEVALSAQAAPDQSTLVQEGPVYGVPQPPTPKIQLRRDIRAIVLVLVGILVVQGIVALTGTMVLMFTSPDFINMMAQALSNPDAALSLDSSQFDESANFGVTANTFMLLQVISVLAAIPLLLFLRGKKLFTHDLVVVNKKISFLSLVKILVLMLGIASVVTYIQILCNFLGISFHETLGGAMEEMMSSPLGLLYIMLLGPIFEELVFRGAILNRLSRHGHNFAIVVSALLFGVYHMFFFQAFNAAFLGILLAYVALRYSLKWAMVLHVVYNSLLMGLTFLGELGLNAEIVSSIPVGICAVVSIIMLIVKHREIPKTIEAGTAVTAKPFATAFSSPWLILFIIAFLGMGVLMEVVPIF